MESGFLGEDHRASWPPWRLHTNRHPHGLSARAINREPPIKLATPTALRRLTGQQSPEGQYDVLTRELGLRPILADGKVRIYQEAILQAMVYGDRTTKPKPKLNIE